MNLSIVWQGSLNRSIKRIRMLSRERSSGGLILMPRRRSFAFSFRFRCVSGTTDGRWKALDRPEGALGYAKPDCSSGPRPIVRSVKLTSGNWKWRFSLFWTSWRCLRRWKWKVILRNRTKRAHIWVEDTKRQQEIWGWMSRRKIATDSIFVWCWRINNEVEHHYFSPLLLQIFWTYLACSEIIFGLMWVQTWWRHNSVISQWICMRKIAEFS